MGDFRKKISCKPISKKNISRMKIPTLKKKNLSWCIILEKKILHLCMSGKKMILLEVWKKNSYPKQITHSLIPPNRQKSNGWPLRTFLSARLAHNVFIVSLPA